jgi:hypothetical protein
VVTRSGAVAELERAVAADPRDGEAAALLRESRRAQRLGARPEAADPH